MEEITTDREGIGMKLLTFDVETLPCNDGAILGAMMADLNAAAEAEILNLKAPSNYKDAEKIAEYIKAKAAEIRDGVEQAYTDRVSKTSFDGMYGRICCISYAFDDGPIVSSAGDDEKSVLEHFYSHVFDQATTAHHSGLADIPVVVCGHNVAAFDLPFLKHRSIIHGVKPPVALLKAMNARPWDNCIADTMLMWSSDPHRRGSMDRLCKALGIPGKDGFDGSMVAATWPVDPKKVITYCEDDVQRTRAIYKRLTFSA